MPSRWPYEADNDPIEGDMLESAYLDIYRRPTSSRRNGADDDTLV